MGSPLPTPAAADLVAELRGIAHERRARTMALTRAVRRVPLPTLFESLRAVVEQLPLVVVADSATIRLVDAAGKLHLLAATGYPGSDIRVRALEPLDLRLVRSVANSGAFERQTPALGLRWARLQWIGLASEPLGTILLGARTERRPHRNELQLLDEVTEALAERLEGVDRSAAVLRASALDLARSVESDAIAAFASSAVAELRPRERAILELYAEGLGTDEIAQLLFLSRHTVQTHVKSALRTLDVHSRGEAERLVRASRILIL